MQTLPTGSGLPPSPKSALNSEKGFCFCKHRPGGQRLSVACGAHSSAPAGERRPQGCPPQDFPPWSRGSHLQHGRTSHKLPRQSQLRRSAELHLEWAGHPGLCSGISATCFAQVFRGDVKQLQGSLPWKPGTRRLHSGPLAPSIGDPAWALHTHQAGVPELRAS